MYPGQAPPPGVANPYQSPPQFPAYAPPAAYGYPPPPYPAPAPYYGAPAPAPYGGAPFAALGFAYNPYDHTHWADPRYFAAPAPAYNVSPAQFQQLRNHSTADSALRQLADIGKDLSRLALRDFAQPITRVCFMCVNTYTRPSLSLGIGPLNDAITCGAVHRLHNFFIYFLHNPTTRQFLDYLRVFLRLVTESLTVYYSGHGSQVADRSGDEADGKDEVMVFDDGYVVDDTLADMLKKNCTGRCRVVLISDCCRSGTIWDIPANVREAERRFPPNIVSFSASADCQTSKQAGGLGQIRAAQGLFTFHFFRLAREYPGITPEQIILLVNREIRQYQQTCVVLPTRAALMSSPIFPT
jgi:hypothetical protein